MPTGENFFNSRITDCGSSVAAAFVFDVAGFVAFFLKGGKDGEERLRVNITRGHTQEDMDMALELLKTYGEAFFVLSGEDIGPMEA